VKNKIILGGLVVTSMMFSGCATLLGGGGDQNININSNKQVKGSIQYSDGEGVQYFTAPATLHVDRTSKDIIVKSENGEFNDQTVESSLNPWFVGNVIIGGVIGSTTDSVSGAAWKYDNTVSILAK